MAVERGLEVEVAHHRVPGSRQRVARGGVERGEERHHLLDPHGLPRPDLERQDLLDVVLHLVEAAFDDERLAPFEDGGASRLTDVVVRLTCLGLQRDHLGPERPGRGRLEVASLELPVASDTTVGHAPVDRRDDLHVAGPVLGRERPFDARVVHIGHADEPPAPQRRLTAAAVAEPHLPADRRTADVELVPVVERLDLGEPDRGLALDPQLEHEPVRQVDEVLVQDGQPAQDRRLTVVGAVSVGAGVVHPVGVLPLGRAPGAEVAVARGGERLPQTLLCRVETLVRE